MVVRHGLPLAMPFHCHSPPALPMASGPQIDLSHQYRSDDGQRDHHQSSGSRGEEDARADDDREQPKRKIVGHHPDRIAEDVGRRREWKRAEEGRPGREGHPEAACQGG